MKKLLVVWMLVLWMVFLAARAWADPFADAVVEATVGTGGGGGAQSNVLGPPHGAGPFQGSMHTFSLGLGGSITVAFTDNAIVDRPGPDFTVFENRFSSRASTPVRRSRSLEWSR
jgi:hypothetical protein